MYKSQTIIAIVPARGGSKGIKDKNIIDFGGKPLIYHSIKAALDSKYIDEVFVSTDSEKIAQAAKECGANVPFLRPAEFATDDAPTNLAIMDMLNKLTNQRKKRYDHIMLLQPTSPLRETKHIDEAVKMYFDSGFENLVSVKPLEDGLELIYSREGDGSLKKFLQDDNHSARRQDFKKYYVLNGAIYLTNVKRYLTNGGFYSGRTLSYVMDTESSVDIDNMLDLELARLIYKKRKELR